jgi:LysM repeat protein
VDSSEGVPKKISRPINYVCQNLPIPHHFAMRLTFLFLASCAISLLHTSCATSGGGGNSAALANTGPFDHNGNYIEEWADNPSKWRKSGGAPSPHELKSDQLPEIALNDQPPQHSVPLAPSNSTRSVKPVASAGAKPVLVKPKTQPVAATKPKPKPAAKPAPKPTQTRYVVKKGDSLSSIASRNGSTVSLIQKANRITGTLIHPGQSLVVPKR